MAYTLKDWKRRIAERTDMSSGLVHLTREKVSMHDLPDVLFSILSSKKLIGSTTNSGFICGNNPAVCFQDAPLTSICQNSYYEENKSLKIRYRPVGFYFEKTYVFRKGGRPVVYDKIEDAKKYIPKEEWWRIVNMDLSNSKNIIDWSHEREWRVKGDFQFELKELTLLVKELSLLKDTFLKYKDKFGVDLRDEIKGIVTLANILY